MFQQVMSLIVERSCPWRSVHTSNWPNVAYPAAYRLWSATSFCGRAVDSSPCSSPTVVCYLVSCWRAPPRPCFCTSAASAPLRLGSPRVGPLLPPSYGLHLGPLPRLLASSLWPPTRPSILWPSSFPPFPPPPPPPFTCHVVLVEGVCASLMTSSRCFQQAHHDFYHCY